MNWTEITVKVPPETVEMASGVFYATGVWLKEFHALWAVSRFVVSNSETLKQAAKPHETLSTRYTKRLLFEAVFLCKIS